MKVFEFLRDPDAFHTIGNAIREMAEAADPDEVSIPPFRDDLHENLPFTVWGWEGAKEIPSGRHPDKV